MENLSGIAGGVAVPHCCRPRHVPCDPVILEQFNIIVVFHSFILVICRNVVFFVSIH